MIAISLVDGHIVGCLTFVWKGRLTVHMTGTICKECHDVLSYSVGGGGGGGGGGCHGTEKKSNDPTRIQVAIALN